MNVSSQPPHARRAFPQRQSSSLPTRIIFSPHSQSITRVFFNNFNSLTLTSCTLFLRALSESFLRSWPPIILYPFPPWPEEPVISSSRSSLGAPDRRVVRVHRAPGALDLVLRAEVQHFFEDGLVIRTALDAGGSGGAKSQFLTAVAADHDTLRAPSVDSAHLHVLYLVVCVDTLDNPRHCRSPFLSPYSPYPQVIPKQWGTRRR